METIEEIIKDDEVAAKVMQVVNRLIDKAYLLGVINGGGEGFTTDRILKEIDRIKSLGYSYPHQIVTRLTNPSPNT